MILYRRASNIYYIHIIYFKHVALQKKWNNMLCAQTIVRHLSMQSASIGNVCDFVCCDHGSCSAFRLRRKTLQRQIYIPSQFEWEFLLGHFYWSSDFESSGSNQKPVVNLQVDNKKNPPKNTAWQRLVVDSFSTNLKKATRMDEIRHSWCH